MKTYIYYIISLIGIGLFALFLTLDFKPSSSFGHGSSISRSHRIGTTRIIAGTENGILYIGSNKKLANVTDPPGDTEVLSYDLASNKYVWVSNAGGGGGGGDNVTVNGVAVDTTANFLDGDVKWTLVDGGAGGPDDVTGTFEANSVDDTHIDFGTGANQVSASDMPNEDVGQVSISSGVYTVEDFTLNDDGDANSNKIINVTDPTNDQDAATKIYVDAATAAFNIDFFFNNTASDVGGIYFDMTSAALGGGESLLGAALSASTNDQAIANFLTDDTGGLGILDIPAGTFEVHYHAEKTAGNSTVNIYAEIYKRASGGAETLIVTSQTSGLVTSKAEFSLFAHSASDTNLLATDRIVVKFLANLGSGSGATVALYQEGTTVSRLAFPTTSEILNQIFLRQDGGVGTGVYDFGGADSFEIVNGTSPTVDAAGEIAVDTTDDQLIYYGSTKRVISSSIPRSAVIENLKAADDGLSLGMINEAITITSIGVHCDGTCTTPADIALSDRAGNAMTHTTPTVSTGTGNTTFAAVTSNNSLAAGEGLEFSVTNAVSPETDTYTISFTYTLDAQ